MWSKRLLIILGVGLIGCEPSPQNLLEQAERERARQRTQVAQHLYVHVIGNTKGKDHTRFQALRGLTLLSFNQSHDYLTGLKAVDRAITDFGEDSSYQSSIDELRLLAADVARFQMQDAGRALQYVEPMRGRRDLKAEDRQKIGRLLTDAGNYEHALLELVKAWELAEKDPNCRVLASLQLDIMQVYTLSKKCDETLKWSEKKLPASNCTSDKVSVQIERANCFEILGEVEKTIDIYDQLLKEDPQNTRVGFLMSSVKKRQRDKLRK